MANGIASSIIAKMRQNTKRLCQPIRERTEREQTELASRQVSRPVVVVLGGSDIRRGMTGTRYCLRR
jgi:hypothetical protein